MCDSYENDTNEKHKKGDEDMSAITEARKALKAKKYNKKIPHLKTENGKVVIDANDPKQVKWFEEFKK